VETKSSDLPCRFGVKAYTAIPDRQVNLTWRSPQSHIDLPHPAMLRRIRALVPNAKIIFLSCETSADVVEEALSTGARAYVQKAKAGRQLLAVIDAAISNGALR
jgi:DNA-binding NarL/FixJ family response regulator